MRASKSGVLSATCERTVFTFNAVSYRLIYQLEGEVVAFIAVGPHDAAYASATRRV